MKVDHAFSIITYSIVITWRNDIVPQGLAPTRKKYDLSTYRPNFTRIIFFLAGASPCA